MTTIERIAELLSANAGKTFSVAPQTQAQIRELLIQARDDLITFQQTIVHFQPQNKYHAGQRVLVGDGSISGIVERVIFLRNAIKPFYLVEWWKDGQVCQCEFHEDDVAAA